MPIHGLSGGLCVLKLSGNPALTFGSITVRFLNGTFRCILGEGSTHVAVVNTADNSANDTTRCTLQNGRGVRIFVLSPRNGVDRFRHTRVCDLASSGVRGVTVSNVFSSYRSVIGTLRRSTRFGTTCGLKAIGSVG